MLDNFLEQLAQGGQFEGEGVFTIDAAKAAMKLSRYRLGDAGGYLLKLVQAGTAAGATRMAFVLSRSEVKVNLEITRDVFDDAAGLGQSLARQDLVPEGPLRHLAIALGAALSVPHTRLAWGVQGADCGQALWLEGNHARWDRLPGHGRSPDLRLCRFQLRRKSSWRTRHQEGRVIAREKETLEQRCALAPLELTINGKRLWAHHPLGLPVLEERVTAPVDGPALAFPAVSLKEFTTSGDGYWTNKRRFFRKKTPRLYHQEGEDSERLRLLWTVSGLLRRDGHLHFVVDGVVSRPMVVRSLPLDAWLAVDGVKTDLSGLEVVSGQEVEEVMSELRMRLESMKKEFLKRCEPAEIPGHLHLFYDTLDPLVGTRLGEYVLLHGLGPQRYAAFDSVTGQEVLLILVESERHILDRLKTEIEAWQKLHHPNLAPLSIGSVEDRFFLVSLSGEDLQYRLGRGIDPTLALSVVRQLADALDYLHSKDVCLRKFRLDSFTLGADDRLLVACPELQTAFDAAEINHMRLNEALQEVHFLSPERITDSRTALNPAADQYALGVLAYRLTTGRFPFEGEEIMALVVAHLQTDPIDPREHVAELPEHQAQAIMRALSKSPGERFASVAEFAEAFAGPG